MDLKWTRTKQLSKPNPSKTELSMPLTRVLWPSFQRRMIHVNSTWGITNRVSLAADIR